MKAIKVLLISIGALLAQSTFGQRSEENEEKPERPSGYWSQIFLMAVGALFLAFNIAPTEEIVLLAYMMTPWHIAVLALLSIVAMHAFVYAVDFSGGHELTQGHDGDVVSPHGHCPFPAKHCREDATV